MRKYLKLFENHTQYETFIGGGDTPFVRPNVSHCIAENEVHYNPFSWAKEYLTFVALEDGEFGFTPRNGYAISYSIDNGKTWEAPASDTHQTVSAGSKVMWKSAEIMNTTNSTNGGLLKSYMGGIGTFTSTGQFEVKGNIMSLVSGDSFANADELINGKKFNDLFQNCTGLTSAENLILPATVLTNSCYGSMFIDCTSLTTAPELPATTLASGCYANMFNGCISLTKAPELPATTLEGNCYDSMLCGCTSLITAPELPATTLAQRCYSYMFQGCTSLTTAPKLPATTLASGCYQGMFNGCASLRTAPELPATTLVSDCYSYMFQDCTSLIAAPQLPATTLASGCYQGMFNGCASLRTAPELPATTLVQYCYENMFNGCASLNYIKAMFTTTPSGKSPNYYTTNWVSGVASSGTFVKNAAATWEVTGKHGIPSGWTVETATE